MTTLYDLFPKKDGMYAYELTYNIKSGYFYLLYFNPDGDDGDGEFVENDISRRDIREAKKAYDSETEDVKKQAAFISSIYENCRTWISDRYDDNFDDYIKTYTLNAHYAVSGSPSGVMIFFGLSTSEENIDVDAANEFIKVLTYSIEDEE